MWFASWRWMSLLAVLVLGTGSSAVGQCSLRQWGSRSVFDTEVLALPCTAVSAKWATTAFLRADGRIFLQGQESGYAWPLRMPAPLPGLTYVGVEMGDQFALGLLSDGAAVFSSNTRNHFIPPAPAGTSYTSVAAGYIHALLLRSDGVLVTWGGNNAGQLSVPSLPSGIRFVKVDARGDYSLGLRSDGQIEAWGDNWYGQCNVPALPAGLIYIDVHAGKEHALAIRSDGTIVGWGDNAAGQLNVPALPPGMVYTMCSAGYGFGIALRSDGVLVGWGENGVGQLNCPTAPLGEHCIALESGHHHTIALWSDGTFTGWGSNMQFQYYVPGLRRAQGPSTDPDDGYDPDRFVSIACGSRDSYIIRADGTAEAFGGIDYSGFGNWFPPTPPTGVRYTALRPGRHHLLALRSDGQLAAFWDNSFGQSSVPILPAGVVYLDAEASEVHSVALRSDLTAVAFGANVRGECNIPTPPPGVGYVQVDAAYLQTLLLRSDGQIVHVGDTTGGMGLIPALPPGLRYVDIAADQFQMGAIRSDGEFVWWGTSSNQPVVTPSKPWGVYYVDADAGQHFVCLRRSDGHVAVAALPYSGPGTKGDEPPLQPGTSYVEIAADDADILGRVGPTCIYVGVAPGCSGTLPATKLVPRDTPRIGRTQQVTLFDLPANAAILVTAWQRRSPLDLGLFGAPGCLVHVANGFPQLVAGQGQQGVAQLSVPDRPALVGVRFYQQALVLDPVGNGLGVVASDTMEGVVGHW